MKNVVILLAIAFLLVIIGYQIEIKELKSSEVWANDSEINNFAGGNYNLSPSFRLLYKEGIYYACYTCKREEE